MRVFLLLHGAAIATVEPDPMARCSPQCGGGAIRCPVLATLDLHGNVSEAMRHADYLRPIIPTRIVDTPTSAAPNVPMRYATHWRAGCRQHRALREAAVHSAASYPEHRSAPGASTPHGDIIHVHGQSHLNGCAQRERGHTGDTPKAGMSVRLCAHSACAHLVAKDAATRVFDARWPLRLTLCCNATGACGRAR